MTCQSLFGVGDGDGVGDAFALAEDLADDFVDALDLALDLAASDDEASESERTPAMAKEQSRRLIILYKMQEKCHFANRMPIGDGMCLGRSKIAGRRPQRGYQAVGRLFLLLILIMLMILWERLRAQLKIRSKIKSMSKSAPSARGRAGSRATELPGHVRSRTEFGNEEQEQEGEADGRRWTSQAFRRSFNDAKAYLSSTHWFAGSWQFVRPIGAG